MLALRSRRDKRVPFWMLVAGGRELNIFPIRHSLDDL
jgi:hypothetical protein